MKSPPFFNHQIKAFNFMSSRATTRDLLNVLKIYLINIIYVHLIKTVIQSFHGASLFSKELRHNILIPISVGCSERKEVIMENINLTLIMIFLILYIIKNGASHKR